MNDAAAASDLELHLERLIPAPPERVFAMWSEPELLAKWLAPGAMAVDSCAVDANPGGFWRVTMRHPDGKLITVSGVFRKVEPPLRLIFTWAWLDLMNKSHETEVTVTLTAAPGGTRLVLYQREFESKESRDRHEHGWGGCFDKLAAAAAK